MTNKLFFFLFVTFIVNLVWQCDVVAVCCLRIKRSSKLTSSHTGAVKKRRMFAVERYADWRTHTHLGIVRVCPCAHVCGHMKKRTEHREHIFLGIMEIGPPLHTVTKSISIYVKSDVCAQINMHIVVINTVFCCCCCCCYSCWWWCCGCRFFHFVFTHFQMFYRIFRFRSQK